MLAIARALLTGPVAPEPSQGLEQNAEMALGLADRVYIIDHGTIVFEGTPAALRANERITTAYLGVGG